MLFRSQVDSKDVADALATRSKASWMLSVTASRVSTQTLGPPEEMMVTPREEVTETLWRTLRRRRLLEPPICICSMGLCNGELAVR